MKSGAIFIVLVVIVAILLLVVGTAAAARSRLIEDKPGALKDARLLREVIEQARQNSLPVHIVYVHGMRAEEPGASQYMRAELEKYLRLDPQAAVHRRFIDLGPAPTAAEYVERKIWNSDEEWLASRPFVDRFELNSGGSRIIVDEVNWWPLLFPMKCRFLLVLEDDLSGSDEQHIELCAMGEATGRSRQYDQPQPIYYPWISAEERDHLLRSRARSGGGSWPNAGVKQQIMNWGLSDAVIALGPMRQYVVAAMDKAFDVQDLPADAPKIVVAESLGSFVVLDSMRSGAENVKSFVNRTADLYFFANQFALLELARISLPAVQPSSATAKFAPEAAEARVGSALSQLQPPSVRSAPQDGTKSLESLAAEAAEFVPKQVIAFSDPSDILTWRVPEMEGVKIVNVYVPATGGPFRILAHPTRAHRGAITSKSVWNLLLHGKGTPKN